jgi:hypothetical protein
MSKRRKLTVSKALAILQKLEKQGKGGYLLCTEQSDPDFGCVPNVLSGITHNSYDGDLVVVY